MNVEHLWFSTKLQVQQDTVFSTKLQGQQDTGHRHKSELVSTPLSANTDHSSICSGGEGLGRKYLKQ